MNQEIKHVGKLREKLQQDPQRPIDHLMASADYNMAFDPHGCIHWKG